MADNRSADLQLGMSHWQQLADLEIGAPPKVPGFKARSLFGEFSPH